MERFKFDFSNYDFNKMGANSDLANDFVDAINETEGLNNDFPALNLENQLLLDKLLDQRSKYIHEYQNIVRILEPLLKEEVKVWESLDDVSNQICQLQGHRLSMYPTGLIDYQNGKLVLVGSTRFCIICGKYIYQADRRKNDVVVKTNDEDIEKKVKIPKRILYKKDNG